MRVKNVSAQMINFIIPGQEVNYAKQRHNGAEWLNLTKDEGPSVDFEKVRNCPAMLAGLLVEIKGDEAGPKMPTPRAPDLSKMTIDQAIAYVEAETDLPALGRLAQGERRPAVLTAIRDRAEELEPEEDEEEDSE